jgi:hypothetical protein
VLPTGRNQELSVSFLDIGGRYATVPWFSIRYDELSLVVTRMPVVIFRTCRLHMAIPVIVHGNLPDGTSFEISTHTLVVSENGGLIAMAQAVVKGQSLRMRNLKTGKEIQCAVANVREEGGEKLAGITFNEPSPTFWGIFFPPEDWDPAHRKRPESLHSHR